MKPIQTPQTHTNFIKHQELFYEIVKAVDVINCSHIALYQALFRCWNFNYFMNPVQYPRDQIMGMAGIRSKSVYYKIIRELESFDLIRYYPSNQFMPKVILALPSKEKMTNFLSHCGGSQIIRIWAIRTQAMSTF